MADNTILTAEELAEITKRDKSSPGADWTGWFNQAVEDRVALLSSHAALAAQLAEAQATIASGSLTSDWRERSQIFFEQQNDLATERSLRLAAQSTIDELEKAEQHYLLAASELVDNNRVNDEKEYHRKLATEHSLRLAAEERGAELQATVDEYWTVRHESQAECWKGIQQFWEDNDCVPTFRFPMTKGWESGYAVGLAHANPLSHPFLCEKLAIEHQYSSDLDAQLQRVSPLLREISATLSSAAPSRMAEDMYLVVKRVADQWVEDINELIEKDAV